MSRFNTQTIPTGPGSRTTSHEGGQLYKMNPEYELYTTVVNTLLDDKFYEKSTDTVARIRRLVREVDPAFSLRLAVYAREQMYLRSAPQVLIVEILKAQSEKAIARTGLEAKAVVRVCQRPDDMTEMLAYNASINGGKAKRFPHALRKGIAQAFPKFDAYQLGKYKQSGKGIDLVDTMFLTHPKPADDAQAAVWKQLIDGTLVAPDTWEVALSAAGGDAAKKRYAWERLIGERKLGYMATLRNLRNILEANVSKEHIMMVGDYLSNETAVRNSKQLPIRFYSAFVELSAIAHMPGTQVFGAALEKALLHSIRNISVMADDKSTLAIFDVSGSMTSHNLSGSSERTCMEVGTLLAGLTAVGFKNSATMGFATMAAYCPAPTTSVLQWMKAVIGDSRRLGGGTTGSAPFKLLIASGQKYDRVFLYSDQDIHREVESIRQLWAEYRKTNPESKLYIMDLQGYAKGTPVSLFANENAYLVSGWSDRIFDMVRNQEMGLGVLLSIKGLDL